MKHRIRWSEHVTRIEESMFQQQVLFSELTSRKRGRVCLLPRLKDQLKTSQKDNGLDIKSFETRAQDRNKGRCFIAVGTENFESNK